ncbi:alpha/beta hydrolase family protein [Bacillus sp. FJAT-45037]|uniref:alpha/beta hydrolase family protein n=1 Tax=Bacillus sp. FJAT-45037 TaxID=2011007 RepID=UPI000C2322D9|nr:prolyl oligopeptidase family serine peptidase [Bacillus sp. FJAT-45037]
MQYSDISLFLDVHMIYNFAVNSNDDEITMVLKVDEEVEIWRYSLEKKQISKIVTLNNKCYSILVDVNDRLYVTVDDNGNENRRLLILNKNSNIFKNAGGEHVNYIGLIYDEDEGKIYFSNNKNKFSIEERNLLEKESKTLLEDTKPIYLLTKFKDKMVYLKHLKNSHRIAYFYSNGEKYPLIKDDKNEFLINDVEFVGEDKIYFASNYLGEYSNLYIFYTKTKVAEKILEINKEDIKAIYKFDNQTLLLKTVNKTEEFLYFYNTVTGNLVNINSPITNIAKVIVRENKIYILGDSASIPPNIFKYSNGQWDNLTKFRTDYKLVKPQKVMIKSIDNLIFESLYYKNANKSENAIIWLHGGPQSIEKNYFCGYHQFFIKNGFDIITPNFRGSKGYGSEFMKKVEGNWLAPIIDIRATIEFLIRNRYKNIVLMGASYGGYLALMTDIETHYKEVKCSINLYGPTDLIHFIMNAPARMRYSLNKWIGDIETEKERLCNESPAYRFHEARNPILNIYGENDPRVKYKEDKDRIKSSLINDIVIAGEGHGVSRKNSEIKVYNSIYQFIQKSISK